MFCSCCKQSVKEIDYFLYNKPLYIGMTMNATIVCSSCYNKIINNNFQNTVKKSFVNRLEKKINKVLKLLSENKASQKINS